MMNLLIILYVVIFGGAIGVFAKFALQALDPVFLIFIRLVLALAFFTIILVFQKRTKHVLATVFTNWKPFLVLAVSGVGLGMLATFVGLGKTSAINYSLFFNAAPISMIFFSAWLLRQRILKVDMILFFAALLGSLLIITQGEWSFSFLGQDAFFGDILVFIGAVCWGFYSVYGPAICQKQPEVKGLTVIYGAFLLAAIIMAPFVLKMGLSDISSLVRVSEISPLVVASTVMLAILSTAILFLLWLNLVVKEGGVLGSLVFLAEDAAGVLLPLIFLGETLTIPTVLGGVMIILPLALRKMIPTKK